MQLLAVQLRDLVVALVLRALVALLLDGGAAILGGGQAHHLLILTLTAGLTLLLEILYELLAMIVQLVQGMNIAPLL